MANSGAKKVVKSNRQRLQTLGGSIVAVNVIYALVRAVLFQSTPSTFQLVMLGLFNLCYALPLTFLYSSSRPQYGADGATLVDGGHDISQQGLFEYAHDLIYITLVTHVLFIVTNFALGFFLIATGYVVYTALSSLGVLNMLSSRGAAEPNANNDNKDGGLSAEDYASMSRKDRRKAERQATRRQR